jgi:cyclic pyranopterin phosphate synthase
MLLDAHGRPLRALRVSVTDRCNLRCQYCMPEQAYTWLPRDTLLQFDEIRDLTGVFIALGVRKVRITGGEPLLRRGVANLVAQLAALPGIDDLALTTNGLLLGEQAAELRAAGLGRVTVSLDTLRPDRFAALTRRDVHPRVLDGIAAAHRAFGSLKIDAVVVRGLNDDELEALIEFGRPLNAEVRFIEYMNVGGATRWSADAVVRRNEILDRIARRYGALNPVDETSGGPAERFVLPDGATFGIVASTSAPFCGTCDRSRLTADGLWLRCLHAAEGLDLRTPLRTGVATAVIQRMIEEAWSQRTDRGAELHPTEQRNAPPIPVDDLRHDVHLEMHSRGG